MKFLVKICLALCLFGAVCHGVPVERETLLSIEEAQPAAVAVETQPKQLRRVARHYGGFGGGYPGYGGYGGYGGYPYGGLGGYGGYPGRFGGYGGYPGRFGGYGGFPGFGGGYGGSYSSATAQSSSFGGGFYG